MLLNLATHESWPTIWAVIQQDVAFGRTLFEGIARAIGRNIVPLAEFTDDALAELFVWLTRQYSPDEDPNIDGVHAVEPRESVGQWPDRLLSHLKLRGTDSAVIAMRRIINALPDLPWLRWSLLDAQDMARRRSWEPPTPATIIALTSDWARLLVQSGDELLTVLIESLQRLQAKLQGETPAAIDTWNESPGNKSRVYWPKNEE